VVKFEGFIDRLDMACVRGREVSISKGNSALCPQAPLHTHTHTHTRTHNMHIHTTRNTALKVQSQERQLGG
jgi:hypothetical protein